jgi:hypothetical protein
MITCERCGKEIPDTASICPSCGTVSPLARSGMTSSTDYGRNPSPSPTPEYLSGYPPQAVYPPQQSYAQQSQPYNVQQQGYSQPYQAPQPVMYPPVSVNINMQPVAPVATSTNTAAIVVEVLLNLFLGIYGVGWLMAGETTTGVILLICSIVLYWPIMIVGIIFTLGFGLICLGPLAIGAVILNAILLNNAIKRKATYVLVQPMQPFPPQ